MKAIRTRLGLVAFLLLLFPVPAHAALQETPVFAAQVAKGELPPVVRRVPREPSLAELETIGRPGGELRLLMASPKDTRLMVVYGYARLMAYTPALALVPDMLEAAEVAEDRVFTLRLRPGHKWSDGQPFTTEDFRYWFEDVAENPDLSPSGLPLQLLPNGERPHFEVLDEVTVRFTWSRPNPLFLPALAQPDPLFIYCPAHYLKQFHKKYANKEALDALVKQAGVRNWAALHNKLDVMYRNDNPDLPSLEPWILKTRPPADRIVFERNPYYYRVDGAGHQLPYIDRVILSIASSKIIPAKTGAGESDLQARYLSFDDYTFLKAGETANGYKVRLWRTGPGSQLALYPNLNVDDPVWHELVRDVRFRRALSLATNRHEINQVIYFGLAIEGQNTVLPESPLYRPEYREAWASFDPAEANRLLDLIGLKPQARRRRHPAIAGRPAGRHHRRGFRRIHGKIGCARTDPRFLAGGRDQAVLAADPADPVPPPGVFRPDADVDREGHRERAADRGHAALGIRPDDAAATRMAEMGAIPRNQGPGRRAPRSAERDPAQGTLRHLAERAFRRRPRADLA